MAATLKLRPCYQHIRYYQWQWQESSEIWRRYPCTISHKLNSIIDGETIYVIIYDWVYIITKHTSISGTQTNLFTQHSRNIRVITKPSKTDIKLDREEHKDISLYYNYSYANVVLIATLQHLDDRVKNVFYKSIAKTQYEITFMTQVQLSYNNKQYQNYKKHLKEYCIKHRKRKDQIETLLWSNCSLINKQYAHAHNVINILQNEENHTTQYLVYLCRAIYAQTQPEKKDLFPHKINPLDVIDQIPLYLINFKSIENGFGSSFIDQDDDNMIAKSLFAVHEAHADSLENTHSLHSYSQPLLSIKNKISRKNGYGAAVHVQNSKNTATANNHSKSWLELVRSEDDGYFASTFDINMIIDKLLSVRSAKPGTLVNINRADIENICIYAKTILMQQPVFLELEAPICIVGDIHGQYYDLLRLFDHGLYPPQTNYLFLGDYVDRGGQSIETLCLLLCYKIKYEENFFLLRGNHENEGINRIYGFYDECKRRYSVRVWRKFVDVFNHLPIAAVICNKIFCVHGGLSPQLFLHNAKIRKYNRGRNKDSKAISFEDNVKKIQRPTTVGDYGLVCDLLWSDPTMESEGWNDNEDRGVSYLFGSDVVDHFNKHFDIDLICRAHQVVEDGYEFFNKRKLVTIFSAPNYCGEFDNCAAFMQVDEHLMCSFVTLDPQKQYRSQIIKRNF